MTPLSPLLRMPMALLVIMYQSMSLALVQMWNNKVRSLLTTLGIIIGVASVTGVIAAMTGLKKKVLTDFESIGTNKVFVSPDIPETGPKRSRSWEAVRFRPDEFNDLLRHCPSVKTFYRACGQNMKVRHADRVEKNVPLGGIEPAWHEIENRSVILGRPFSLIDEKQGRAVCLINPYTREKLRMELDCVGESIIVGDRRFVVVGVVEPPTQRSLFSDGRQQMEVFVPFTTAWRMGRQNMSVAAAARSPDLSEDARAEMTFYLRQKRHLKPDEPNTFRLFVVQQFIDRFNQIAVSMTLVAAGIVGISLIVGGVGIMNIMLVSVSERTREIGLRKAVGARPATILLQFLVEAVTLCLAGGGVGLLGGRAIATIIAAIPGAKLDRAEVPGWAVLLAFGFSAAVGLIFGMFPAVKAARLDPIEALRHE
jgi:putative ABC transport system permease protein